MATERLTQDERREVTLERVMSLFAENGFCGTRTRDLAEAAGINEALIYRIFGSKEGLYSAIIEKKINEDGEGIFDLEAADRDDDRGVFTTAARDSIRRTNEDPSFLRLLLYSALEDHDLKDMFYEIRVKRVVGFLAEYIERRQQQGAFRSGDPELMAVSFLGMIFNYLLTTRIFAFEELARPEDEVVETMVSLFLSGVKKGTEG